MNKRNKRQSSMKEIAVPMFSFVIYFVEAKFYLLTLENNQTDNIPDSNSYRAGNVDNDFDVLAHENHDYQDCPLPFNPCPSGIR